METVEGAVERHGDPQSLEYDVVTFEEPQIKGNFQLDEVIMSQLYSTIQSTWMVQFHEVSDDLHLDEALNSIQPLMLAIANNWRCTRWKAWKNGC